MKALQMFFLAADKLVRCRWDGRSDQLEIVNTALEGETLREVAQDPANPRRLYAADLDRDSRHRRWRRQLEMVACRRHRFSRYLGDAGSSHPRQPALRRYVAGRRLYQ